MMDRSSRPKVIPKRIDQAMAERIIALRRHGLNAEEMTSHGFHATALMLLNESGKWSMDAVEHALANKEKDAIRRAY